MQIKVIPVSGTPASIEIEPKSISSVDVEINANDANTGTNIHFGVQHRSTMRLWISSSRGKAFPIDVYAVDPIYSIKEKIREREKLLIAQQRLTFEGLTLSENYDLIGGSKLKENSEVQLNSRYGYLFDHTSGSQQMVRVYVKVNSQDHITLDVSGLSAQSLEIECIKSATSSNLNVHCTVREFPLLKIYVEKEDGLRQLYEIKPRQQVIALKEMITEREPRIILLAQQRLFLDGSELADERTFESYNILKNTTIQLQKTQQWESQFED
ncbi:unnamed protein product, partial [Mesorhabditis belari]|uniref:Ubiquitin-like domain-containing protein n=1 Tax=Mesorhabditis belari TaxID=2138241 RepID=A0AAF3FP56_9BILA